MSHVRFLARGIKFDRSCGVFEATFELQCKPLIPEPLITNNDPLLIQPQTSAPPPAKPFNQHLPARRRRPRALDAAHPARGSPGAAGLARAGGGGVRYGEVLAPFLPTCPLLPVRRD